MKREKILVINPADNPEMTQRIDAALAPFRAQAGIEIVCRTARGGPRMVASSADVDAAAVAVRACVSDESADVVIIACYADPGVEACREALRAPVLGVGRCGALAALARADNFGVVAMSEAAIPRHLGALRQSGCDRHCVAERAIAPGDDAFARLKAAGEALRDIDGARAVVIGCAEYGGLRARLEQALNIPVIDPVGAAIGMAMAMLGGS